jgi:putative flippase GtrA
MNGIGERIAVLLSGMRFGKFVSVGTLGALCDNSVLALGLMFGIPPGIAKIAGAEVAILVMFGFNERWTFEGEGENGLRQFIRRLFTSNVVRLGGVLIATAVFLLVYRYVDVQLLIAGRDLWFLVANGCGILSGLFVNYALESTLTWRVYSQP